MATVQGQLATGAPGPVEKATKDLHYCWTLATDVGKEDTKRQRTAKLWMQHAEDVERSDTMRRFASRENAPHTLEAPQASTSSAGAGASEPLYFNDEGQPVYTYMVSVPHVNKHLIKFPIALEPTILRSNRNNVDSPQSVLLKADTGADVNLMNRKTFNQLFGEAKEVLKPTPIKTKTMEILQ